MPRAAVLDGVDPGSPIRLRENPTIGRVRLPARGVLVIGQAMWPIRDPDPFHTAPRQARRSNQRTEP